jgi:3-deoxy-D-manno-octulosonic-acid transferase
MIAFYFFLYALFVLIAAFVLPFNSKIREAILGRIGVVKRARKFRENFQRPPAWIHVASSGEFEQCLPILDQLKLTDPETPIWLSYFSPTAKRALELEGARRQRAGLTVPWDASDFAPFDFPWVVGAFIDAITPKVFVAIHREVWPGILRACGRRGIPKCLIASHFRKAPGWFLKRWLEHFDFIGVIDEKSIQNLLSISGPSVERLGDSRIERVLQRRSLCKEPAWSEFFKGSKTLVLASIWPQDVAEIESSIAGFVQSGAGRIVLAPHEPKSEFVLQLEHFIRDHGGEVRRWSVWKESPDSTSHLVVDKVGELAEIYSVATVAFVGGSFKARVHNVLEPAAYGRPIITGPYIENSVEAMAMFESGALIKIDVGDSLLEKTLELFRDDTLRGHLSTRVTDYVISNRGAHIAYERLINGLAFSPG